MISIFQLLREQYINPLEYFLVGKLNYWPYIYLAVASFLLICETSSMIRDSRVKNDVSTCTLKWIDKNEIENIFSTAGKGAKKDN